MKATGIVKHFNFDGTIEIPEQIKKMLDISLMTPMEIFINGEDEVVLKKYLYNSDKEEEVDVTMLNERTRELITSLVKENKRLREKLEATENERTKATRLFNMFADEYEYRFGKDELIRFLWDKNATFAELCDFVDEDEVIDILAGGE